MAFLVGVRQRECALCLLDALLQDGTADREGKLPPVLPLGELEQGDDAMTIGEARMRAPRRRFCRRGGKRAWSRALLT